MLQNRLTRLAIGAVALLLVCVATMSILPAVRTNRSERGAPSRQSPSTSTSLSAGAKNEYVPFVEWDGAAALGLASQAQREDLSQVAPVTARSYEAGSYSRVCDALMSVRRQKPPNFNALVDLRAADNDLAWFYKSLQIHEHAKPEVVRHTAGGSMQTHWRRAMRNQKRHGTLALHEDGMDVLSEKSAPIIVEVIYPARYTTPDNTEIAARFGLWFRWSEVMSAWVLIGQSLYDFPVNQPIPMIPY